MYCRCVVTVATGARRSALIQLARFTAVTFGSALSPCPIRPWFTALLMQSLAGYHTATSSRLSGNKVPFGVGQQQTCLRGELTEVGDDFNHV